MSCIHAAESRSVVAAPGVVVSAIGEIGVYTGLLGADSARGVIDEQGFEQIQAVVAEDSAALAADELFFRVAGPFGEAGFEVGEAGHTGPVLLARCAENTEDLEDFINLRVAGEKRLAGGHFGKDTANGPHVDACAVLSASEKNFRCAVPESDNLSDKVRG